MTGNTEPQGVSLFALTSALSEPRLEAYRLRADELPTVVLGRYRWNIALGMTFLPALSLLGVCLRNNLHRGWLSPSLLRLLPVGDGFRDVYGRGHAADEMVVAIPETLK